MLRNSFLLKYNCLFSKCVVKKICENKTYLDLIDFNPFINNKKDINNIIDLKKEIIDCYKQECKNKGMPIKNVTDTLVSKIMLGTLGCVPAYDQYLKNGLKKYNDLNKPKNKMIQSFNENSMEAMNTFAIEHKNKIIRTCNTLNTRNGVSNLYTPMKIIDMYFWEIGQ